MKTKPFISVVICTRDRSSLLKQALVSLRDQYLDRAWEVLVVDNGSSDDTAPLVREMQPLYPVPLRLTCEPTAGLSRARNRGMNEANGGILLFVDDDVTFHGGWLQAHADAFKDPTISGSGGRILPVLPPGAPDWVVQLSTQIIGGPASYYDFGDVPAEITADSCIQLPFGGNMGFRREMAERIDPFRTDLGWGGSRGVSGEETDFFERMREAGGRIMYTPAAIVDHHVEIERFSLQAYEDRAEKNGRYQMGKKLPCGFAERTHLIAKSIVRLAILRARQPIVLRVGGKDRLIRHIVRRGMTRGKLRELLSC